MPNALLHQGAVVQCQHAGPAQPTVTSTRVKVQQQAAVTQAAPYTISGCGLSGSGSSPCVSAQWVVAARRVTIEGQPALLDNSTAVCTPTGTGLQVIQTQTRVKGE
jgi:hypothetical protein